MNNFKRLILAGILLVGFTSSVFAAVDIQLNGTVQGATEHLNLVTGGTTAAQSGRAFNIPIASNGLVVSGAANGGATSMATSTNAVPVAYSHVKLNIVADTAYRDKTLANGVAGQRLFIQCKSAPGGTAIITPTTKTGFVSLTFNAIDDIAVLDYIDDTIGWVIESVNSVTINN